MYENEENNLGYGNVSGNGSGDVSGNGSGNGTEATVNQGQLNNTSTYSNQGSANYSGGMGSGSYNGTGYGSYSGSSNSSYSGNGNGSYSGSGSSYTGSSSYSGPDRSSFAGSTQGSTYSNPTYSYGQNSYSYNQNGQSTYGTYQYNANASAQPQQYPVKKKHTVAKVVAAICILTLLVGGVGFAYNVVTRHMGSASQANLQDIIPEEEDSAAVENNTDNKTESSAQTADADNEIKTTTVTGSTMAVVTDVTAVVEEVMPAMVMIHNNYTASASYFGYVQQEEATASGSGIIVGENDSELLIATNYHVIEGADTLEVIFSDDSTVEAVVKGTDSSMDLAVIAVMLDDISSDTKDSIKVATLGNSEALKLGEPAIAIGNALGYGQSVTTGVISAVNREVEISEGTTQTFIQTDAAINPGNSGGALLNLQGEVIGINSNKIGGDTIEGMGYAIPISVAQPIIDKLMNEQTLIKVSSEERGYIGISGVSVTSDVSAYYGIPQGVYVAEVSNGGGAQAAGIQKGDVITEFDGNEITSMDDLQTRLQYYAQGTEVTVTVMRQNGQDYVASTYNVTLGGAPSNSQDADSNAGENQGAGQYDGSQQPAMPGSKGGQPQQGGEGSGN